MSEHEPESQGPPPPPPESSPESAPPPPPSPGPANKDENMWAMLCHLSTLLVFTCIGTVVFANILAPLIIWLLKKQEMPLVDDQGKEVLNFQIGVSICGIVASILASTGFLALIFIPFTVVLAIFALVVTIIGAIKANAGERYRYPLCIRFIK